MWINIWCHGIIFYLETVISNSLGCKTGMTHMSCREPHIKKISCLFLRRTGMAHMSCRQIRNQHLRWMANFIQLASMNCSSKYVNVIILTMQKKWHASNQINIQIFFVAAKRCVFWQIFKLYSQEKKYLPLIKMLQLML